MEDRNNAIRTLERESYTLQQEVKRKKIILQNLTEHLQKEKKQGALKKLLREQVQGQVSAFGILVGKRI